MHWLEKWWPLIHTKTKKRNFKKCRPYKFCFCAINVLLKQTWKSSLASFPHSVTGYVRNSLKLQIASNEVKRNIRTPCRITCASVWRRKHLDAHLVNNMKFAPWQWYRNSRYDCRIHSTLFSLGLKFILYESLCHGWCSAWFGFFFFFFHFRNNVDQLQCSDESATTVLVVVALRKKCCPQICTTEKGRENRFSIQ